MKQTAVEWLTDKLNQIGFHTILIENTINQAKEMEKEQIIDAHLFGLIRPLEIEATKQAREYYNQTFKSE